MEIKRYEGKLKKWNAERGFGFIVAADGGQDVFVHISAFARDGRVPSQGEALTFEVEPDRNGKRSAVRVRWQQVLFPDDFMQRGQAVLEELPRRGDGWQS